jgi:type VI secretion system protein ImpH
MLAEGWRFEFFQLLHLLETWQATPAELGRGGPYRHESLRLVPDPSLTFSPADLRRVEEATDEERAELQARWGFRVTVNFMGLYGVAAPTPVYLTELIGFTDVDADELTDFLDLFNHRILSLFYRAWIKYRYPWRYQLGGADEISEHLLSFIGLEDAEVRQRTGLPTSRLLRYLGLLALRTRPPVGLQLLIADYFGGIETRIDERMFRWVSIPPEGRNQIGAANCRLGVDLSVGEKVPDRAGKLRLVLGPLHFDEYLGFLPETDNFREACALTRLWVGERFEFDVELDIRREEIPEMRMGGLGDGDGGGARLGWTSWVTSAPGLAADPHIVFAAAPHPARASA